MASVCNIVIGYVMAEIVGAVWWPKKSCKLSLKYEINNENNFAVVATFVERSRKMWKVNDDEKDKFC